MLIISFYINHLFALSNGLAYNYFILEISYINHYTISLKWFQALRFTISFSVYNFFLSKTNNYRTVVWFQETKDINLQKNSICIFLAHE